MSPLALLRRLSPEVHMLLALSLITASGVLLWRHAVAVREMREVGLPAAIALPKLEERLDVLREQNEAAQLQAELSKGTEEELMHLYILPPEEETTRLLATFDVLFGYLEQKRLMRLFPRVTLGELVEENDELSALPISFETDLTKEGMKELLSLIDLTGLLTISDAVDADALDQLLKITEQENPAAIASLEQFLATDLRRYAVEPRPYEDQLRRSFASPDFEIALGALLDSPQLRSAREILSVLGPILERQKLWPMRLLTVENASFEAETEQVRQVKVELKAYVRGK